MSFWTLTFMFTNFSKCFEEKFDQRYWFELRNKAKENHLVWTYFKEQFWCLDEISSKVHFWVGILVINKLKKFFVRVIFVPPRNQSKLNPPMPDSKSAQSWYFFSILEINNILGFRNVFPKLHEPSWFWFFFVFSWNSLFFCASLHAKDFAKNWCKTKWPCFS